MIIKEERENAVILDDWCLTRKVRQGYMQVVCYEYAVPGPELLFVRGRIRNIQNGILSHLGLLRSTEILEVSGRFFRTKHHIHRLGRIQPAYKEWLEAIHKYRKTNPLLGLTIGAS